MHSASFNPQITVRQSYCLSFRPWSTLLLTTVVCLIIGFSLPKSTRLINTEQTALVTSSILEYVVQKKSEVDVPCILPKSPVFLKGIQDNICAHINMALRIALQIIDIQN